jgi:hypothetical protein
MDWSEVSAIATAIYGAATLLLVIQIWRDRVQRGKHFETDVRNRKLNDLHSAFYESVGYWLGHKPENRSGSTTLGAEHSSRVFEALTRLECQLRLNGYKDEALNLGSAVRTLDGVDDQLSQIGIKLGLFAQKYHRTQATAFR